MLEACLRLLFTSKDLSAVKDYCTRQWGKILSNRVSVQVRGWLPVHHHNTEQHAACVACLLLPSAHVLQMQIRDCATCNVVLWCAASFLRYDRPQPPMKKVCVAASQDFVFCKEVRLGSYSANAATLPPAAIVAAKAMAADPRAEPKHGERVPFVVRR